MANVPNRGFKAVVFNSFTSLVFKSSLDEKNLLVLAREKSFTLARVKLSDVSQSKIVCRLARVRLKSCDQMASVPSKGL